MNAFFNGVFVFDFEPFFEKVVINLRLYSNAFVAFFGVLLPLDNVTERTFI